MQGSFKTSSSSSITFCQKRLKKTPLMLIVQLHNIKFLRNGIIWKQENIFTKSDHDFPHHLFVLQWWGPWDKWTVSNYLCWFPCTPPAHQVIRRAEQQLSHHSHNATPSGQHNRLLSISTLQISHSRSKPPTPFLLTQLPLQTRPKKVCSH